ncbi:partial Transcriptional regulatory protein DegU, partial [Rhodocyclaceae bacterium]
MKILVVDDHSLFREGLHLLLARLGADIEIFDAGSADAGLAFASQCGDIDLILLDVNLPGLRGLDSLRLFRQSFPDSRIILLSGVDASPL